jgi:hypothetical protein
VLWERERALERVPLLVDEDRAGLEVDLLPAERVELAGTHPLVDRNVEVGGERRRRKLVAQRDEPCYVRLRRRLRVATAAART